MLQLNNNENYFDAINDYNLPIDETHYNPDNYSQYLSNEHYHHSDKGCDIEVVVRTDKELSGRGNKSVNKICHTHDKVCSKTGWELGWYMGQETKKLEEKKKFTCVICGIEILSYQSQVFCCKDCRPEYIRKSMRERTKKIKEQYGLQRNNAKSQISNDVREGSN